MSNEQETIADILAEMRRFGDRHWMHDEGQSVRMFADRIEAAAERECSTQKSENCVGNAAAMRAAIKKAIGMILGEVITGRARFKPVIDVLEAALAAPQLPYQQEGKE